MGNIYTVLEAVTMTQVQRVYCAGPNKIEESGVHGEVWTLSTRGRHVMITCKLSYV